MLQTYLKWLNLLNTKKTREPAPEVSYATNELPCLRVSHQISMWATKSQLWATTFPCEPPHLYYRPPHFHVSHHISIIGHHIYMWATTSTLWATTSPREPPHLHYEPPHLHVSHHISMWANKSQSPSTFVQYVKYSIQYYNLASYNSPSYSTARMYCSTILPSGKYVLCPR